MLQRLLLLSISCLLLSCSAKPKDKGQSREWFNAILLNNQSEEATPEQDAAFSALNELQTNSDIKNRLYMTFGGIYHSCYPADTSFLITRSELHTALTAFGKQYYTGMEQERLDQLINTAVLLKEDYTVLHCREGATDIDYDQGPPLVGRWIMPSVLGRSDIIMVW